MALCSAYWVGGEVGIQVSLSFEVATVMGLVVLIITLGRVVSVVLLVVLIHSVVVLLVCRYSDLLKCESCIPVKDCCIEWFKTCALRILWFGGWCYFLALGVLTIADELFTGIIILDKTSLMVAGAIATASEQIVFTICMQEVAGGGLVLWHVWSVRRDGEMITGDSVRSCR